MSNSALPTSEPAPLVSVVIPVYNGAATLSRAVESVLSQTHRNFDLTIIDNCSTDGTSRIAAEFAAKDARVRVIRNTEFLSVLENHNKAFESISSEAKYVKILDADDWFFPRCIEELVRVAERHPSVGMVTSWVLRGSRVAFDGLRYPTEVISGRDVCRARLLQNIRVFGGPSASLFRADIVRARRPFYDPRNYHGDAEACLAVLQHHDFGYVQQVLSYMHHGEESRTTTYLERVGSYPAGDLSEMTNFGPLYLTPDEFARRMREVKHAYYQFLAHNVFSLSKREFWRYHFVQLRQQGLRVSRTRLAAYSLLRLLDIVGNPKRTLEGIVRRCVHLVAHRPPAKDAGRPPSAPTSMKRS